MRICTICHQETDSNLGWFGKDEQGDEVYICPHCIEDYISEDEDPVEGLWCSLCFDDIEDPEGTWIWKRRKSQLDNTCICPKCFAKGDLFI